MLARRLFLSFLSVVALLLIGLLPFLGQLPLKKTGSYAPKTVSVFTIKPTGEQKLGSRELEDILLQTRQRLGGQGELVRLDSNRFLVKTSFEQNPDLELEEFKTRLSKKPVLTLTNFQAQPLFFRGHLETSSFKTLLDSSLKEELFSLPLEGKAASYKFIQDTNTHSVELKTTSNALNLELVKAQLGVKDLPNGNNELYLWQNLREFVEKQSKKDPAGWAKAEQNPVTYAVVKNPLPLAELEDLPPHVLQLLEKLNPTLIKEEAREYLIGVVRVNVVENSKAFEFSNPLTGSQAKALAAQINFANANYSITPEYSYFQEADSNSFTSSFWILLILILFVGLALVFSYRFSGLIASLFLTVTVTSSLWFFSVFGLGFSDLGFQVLIFTVLALFSNTVYFFEVLRVEFSKQLPLEGALAQAARVTLKDWLSSFLILLIIATVLLYNQDSSISQLGESLVFGQVSSGFFGVLGLRVTLSLLVQGGVFKEKHWFFGLQKNVGENSTLSLRVLRKLSLREEPQVLARFFQNILFVSGFIVLVVFRVKYPLETQWGLNLEPASFGTHQLLLSTQKGLKLEEALSIKEALLKEGVLQNLAFEVLKTKQTPSSYSLSIRGFDQAELEAVKNFLTSSPFSLNFKTLVYDNFGVAQNWRGRFVLLLFFLFIQFIVSVFIWRFSFSIALLSISLQALFLQLLPLAFSRENFLEHHFSTILLGWLLFSQQTVMSLSQVKLQADKLLGVQFNQVLSRFDIKHLVKLASFNTFKPRLLTLLASGVLVGLLLIFGAAPSFVYLWVGVVLTQTLTGLGLVSRVYKGYLEAQNRFKAQRMQTYFWEVQNPVEQTFTGINDFRY